MSNWIPTTKNKGNLQIGLINDEAIVRNAAAPPDFIGRMTSRHIEGVDRPYEGHFVVTNIYSDRPNGSGDCIKRGTPQEIISSISIPVTFHVDDGKQREDGGHLTGDGPVFARKMVVNGVTHWEEGHD